MGRKGEDRGWGGRMTTAPRQVRQVTLQSSDLLALKAPGTRKCVVIV